TSPDADGAILGASIRTLDPAQPRASAIAWRDGTIVAVGSDDDVRAVVGAGTEVLDGAGMHVTPGLVDAHIHPFHGTLNTRGVDRGRLRRGRDADRGAAGERRDGPRARRRAGVDGGGGA